MRSAPIVVTAVLGSIGLGWYGSHLRARNASFQDLALRDEGHQLYWQTRRTDHVHEDWERVMQLFLRTEDRQAVIERLELAEGEHAADVGCGTGFYTLALASAVGPEGRIFGVDIQEESLEFLEQRIASHGCEGCAPVELVHNRLDDVGLPAASVDAALMAHLDFYAYRPLLPENERMIASSVRALRPGGRLVVTQDLRPIPGGAVEHIVANFEAAGLSLRSAPLLANETALLVFDKPTP
jgi:ubiquinone/menaquinone biosynthesis C-methylase UbiE